MRGRAAGRWPPQGGGPRARPSAGGGPGHRAYTKAGRARPGLPAGRRAAKPAAWASRAPPGRRERRRRRRRFPGPAPLGPRLPIHRRPGRLRRSPRRGPPGREVGGERTHTPPLVPGRKMAAPGAPRPPRPSGAPGRRPLRSRRRYGRPSPAPGRERIRRASATVRARVAAPPPPPPGRRSSPTGAGAAAPPPALPLSCPGAARGRSGRGVWRPPPGPRRAALRGAGRASARLVRTPAGGAPAGRRASAVGQAAGERGRGPAAAAPRAAAPRRPRVHRRRRAGWNRAWEVARGLHAFLEKLPKLSFEGKKPLFMCLRPESPMACFARQPRRCR